MQSQTNTCITKSSRADKRENRAQIILTAKIDTSFFWTLTTIQFFKEAWPFGNQLCFQCQEKKHLNWWILSIELVSDPDHHRNNNLRYVPENSSSPKVVTG
jgi:hypothetical protein